MTSTTTLQTKDQDMISSTLQRTPGESFGSSFLAQPSARTSAPRALCAWCHNDFHTIVELIDHVTDHHIQTTFNKGETP
jgi:hypothetical protein